MARLLSIDYGTRRCGLAMTDPMQIIASPAGFVDTSSIYSHLTTLIQTHEIETLVIGYPLKSDGTPTDATPHVDEFVKTLNKKFPDKQIALQDEYGTSKMAVEQLVKGGVKKKSRREKGRIDEMSATLILQHYLEER